jgi:hypothetical protein
MVTRIAALFAAFALIPLVSACGSDSSSDSTGAAESATTQQAEAPTVEEDTTTQEEEPAPAASEPACEEPDGREKASLRFAVRGRDRELKDAPWAIVQKGGVNYMAAEIDDPGPRLVVLVSFPADGAYLSGMKALNGTARTFTDLPDGGNTIPKGGEQTLACMDS